MEALVHQKKKLVLILLKQTQNFVLVSIIMLIIANCLLMESNYLSLYPKQKMLTFQLNFASEVFVIDLVLLTLEKYP